MPTPTNAREARALLADRLSKLSALSTNVGTFIVMAEDARTRGDHIVAKRHLRKALDIEFEMFAETPASGALAELWYLGQEI